MSQIIKTNSGGGGSGIQTIDGDVGSITGSTVTIYTNNAAVNSGSSIEFVNSGTISTLNLTDANGNTILGHEAGNLTTDFADNVGLGQDVLQSLTTSSNNVAIGNGVFSGLTGPLGGGGSNIGIGFQAGGSFTTGTDNIIIGVAAGSAYTTSESQNILLDSAGVTGESRVMRLGDTDPSVGQNKCFIAGITGNTVSNQQFVVINSSTNQLGVTSSASTATAFSAYANATLSNVTGNNVIYDVIFNSTTRNDSTVYNTATGVFTANKTGLWSFSTILFLDSSSGFSTGSEILVSSLGSVESQILCLFGAAAARVTPDNAIIVAGAWMVQMTSGDTMQVQAFSSTSVQDVSIIGGAISSNPLTAASTFSGFFVG